ncbi:uncharacterized protein GGS22DRAFT_188084 [Annulohypoxylon maeteangense]|uniref:uncharacterized protein n=1 Tax=Annulohypoxylon maeteangense TaxID=1927788 RepID=UPI0020077792|nr:uncharacterized protein GGS22DRAFT_188084 [Annulohypoxylon maeteangense]KAI0885796.1 hypothetical protein GGS22DRAFT_188084 [Annulohypoxylon maeteangense]
MDRIVFRLRQLPPDFDKLKTVRLLSEALGVDASTIRIFSLAFSVDPYLPHKVATLMFGDAIRIQQALEDGRRPGITRSGDEWVVKIANLNDNCILDSHFRGLTALYDPPSHKADCIAISGLASHPFGSWQPKGQSKSFMWIRDAMPKSLPNVRPILYGYDSTLAKSHSFQSTFDLALSLISQLKANGWASPTCKPLAFLAHSLGGIILKQTLVSLAGMDRHVDPILHVMKGAAFFGVPNLGMEQSHLEAVVMGQANSELVEALSPKSTYLYHLDEQFSGISYFQNYLFYWCYETMKSPTVLLGSDGKWSRTGPEEILVTPESATRGLHGDAKHCDLIFPINKDHSNIVKFSENDQDYSVLVRLLKQIFFSRDSTGTEELASNHMATSLVLRLPDLTTDSEEKSINDTKDRILKSLLAPETDRRLEQIEKKFRSTFNWVYDLSEPGFKRWLQEDTGLFWIRGKPGSGKSTLMKFIFQDQRTSVLLSDWTGECSYIQAAFFFHHRGTSLQKSFEGLLRSILSQIISQKPSLCKFLQPIHSEEVSASDNLSLRVLQKGLSDILRQEEIPLYLCLFLDALDEFDGPLEFLCRFLGDLGAITPGPNKRIKICFSSRPWELFTSTFRNCAGFQIHDFTKDDITDYCLGSIKEEKISSVALESLIPDIVTRSRGVFLWVKLLINDLAHTNKTNINNIEMRKLLESYPTELDSFYVETIQRIPRAYRRKTYAMLEIVVRSMESPDPNLFMDIVDCSYCKTYSEAEATLRTRDEFALNRSALVKSESRKYCGGLIEVYQTRHGPGLYIQVLHQTVEDFVKDPKFKRLVLEEQSKITVENGYTFLAKYCFLSIIAYLANENPLNISVEPLLFNPSHPPNHPIIDFEISSSYAYQSERTTGRSLKAFIDSIPCEKLSGLKEIHRKPTRLALSVLFHCHLYIIESLADSPTLLQKSREPLLTYAFQNTSATNDAMSAVGSASMIEFLLERGFKIDRDPVVFCHAISEASSRPGLENYVDLIKILLKYGQNPDVNLGKRWRSYELVALHFSGLSQRLFDILLSHGATANILDAKRRTPLDCLCRWVDEYRYRDTPEVYPDIYNKVCLLVSHGGFVTKRGVESSRQLLRELQDAGFPIDDLQVVLSKPRKIPRISPGTPFKKMKIYFSGRKLLG